MGLGAVVVLFCLSFSWDWLYQYGWLALGLLMLLTLIDYFLVLNNADSISITREVQEKLSLGDKQVVVYILDGQNRLGLNAELFDELPQQLNYRSGLTSMSLKRGGEVQKFTFSIKPTMRGYYHFGNTILLLSSQVLGLVKLKKSFDNPVEIEVYPSIIQMKQYELAVFSKTARMAGIRPVRNIGENDEFELIREYVSGDNIKSINWKATSRSNTLMVNQFQNSRSQNVYFVIDKGRAMKMPFDDLTLLDYSINSTLAIANIVLKKYDRVGLITFSEQVDSRIKADHQNNQLSLISKHLFDQRTAFTEPNYGALLSTINHGLKQRSMLFLFTNFEHVQDLKRQLPYLQSMNKRHLLIVIFFENTIFHSSLDQDATNVKGIYRQTLIRKALMEKQLIQKELKALGIQVILTAPQELSINTINKYLEIKAKRMK